jgi:Asp-tRNA(Asn)/Glu-tRNA(Gln) amidotransferase A subunit family amidase
MSIPAGKDMDEHGREGWPVGVGMVGFWGGEELMFKVGSVLERALKEQREKVN